MKTQLVLCTGMMRSGSTWSFNVCRLLAQTAAKSAGLPFWSGYLSLEQTEQFFQQTKGNFPGPTVVKAHGIGPIGHQLISARRGVAVCTYRDPRDCVASMMTFTADNFETAASRITEGLQMLDGYPRDGQTLFIRYEEMLVNRLAEVRKIASHLGVAPDEATIRRIDQLTGIEHSRQVVAELKQRPDEKMIRAAGKRVDPKTWLHDNHIQNPTPGRWRSELTAEQAIVLQKQFAPWLDRLGYAAKEPTAAAIKPNSQPIA